MTKFNTPRSPNLGHHRFNSRLRTFNYRYKESDPIEILNILNDYCDFLEASHVDACESPDAFIFAKKLLNKIMESSDQTTTDIASIRILAAVEFLSQRHPISFAQNPKSGELLSSLLESGKLVGVQNICRWIIWGDYPIGTKLHPAAANSSIVQTLADLTDHSMTPFSLHALRALGAFNGKDLAENESLGKTIQKIVVTPYANEAIQLLESLIKDEPDRISQNRSIHIAIREINANNQLIGMIDAKCLGDITRFLADNPIRNTFMSRGFARRMERGR